MRIAICTTKNSKTVAKPRSLTLNPRHGWAKDSQRVARNKDDALVWPEFGNADDVALRFGLSHTTP